MANYILVYMIWIHKTDLQRRRTAIVHLVDAVVGSAASQQRRDDSQTCSSGTQKKNGNGPLNTLRWTTAQYILDVNFYRQHSPTEMTFAHGDCATPLPPPPPPPSPVSRSSDLFGPTWPALLKNMVISVPSMLVHEKPLSLI